MSGDTAGVSQIFSAGEERPPLAPLSKDIRDKPGLVGPKSRTLSTWLTWFGYQYTCHAEDHRQRNFCYFMGCVASKYLQNTPVIMFVSKDRINNATRAICHR